MCRVLSVLLLPGSSGLYFTDELRNSRVNVTRDLECSWGTVALKSPESLWGTVCSAHRCEKNRPKPFVVAVSNCSAAPLQIKQVLPLLIVWVCCHVVNFTWRVLASSETSDDDDDFHIHLEKVLVTFLICHNHLDVLYQVFSLAFSFILSCRKVGGMTSRLHY